MNNVILIGRLTRDPEIKYTKNGTTIAKFSIAIDRKYTRNDGTKITDFIPIEVLGKSAEYVSSCIDKGSLVLVKGEIHVDRFEDSNTGQDRTFTKIFSNNIRLLSKPNKKDNSEYERQYLTTFNDEDVPF